MASKKYVTTKRSVQSSITELEKLEKTHKSELRMISTVAFKFKSKYLKGDDPRRLKGDTEASNVRMYETHFPGFCYQKDGKYKKVVSSLKANTSDSTESSEKVKALLFTDNELDIEKVICLHLLGTHVHNRKHIQRSGVPLNENGKMEDHVHSLNPRLMETSGLHYKLFLRRQAQKRKTCPQHTIRYCRDMYWKHAIYTAILQMYPCEPMIHTALSKKIWGNGESFRQFRLFKIYDYNLLKLIVLFLDLEFLKKSENYYVEQVPIYENNGIRAIISSVLEALEAVNSPKLNELVNLARNTEELKNLFSQEHIQDYIIELTGKQLINDATYYDFSITYPVFDKISDAATTEVVAQVLDVAGFSGLRNMLCLIRKNLSRRYEELVLCNVIPGKKKFKESKKRAALFKFSRTSFIPGIPSSKTLNSALTTGVLNSDFRFSKVYLNSDEKLNNISQLEVINGRKSEKNSTSSLLRSISSHKVGSRSLRSFFPNYASERNISFPGLDDSYNEENVAPLNSAGLQHWGRHPETEPSKYDFKSLSNSQRILLGLKVASMKSRPINMHHFENKKKLDIGSIITSIVHPLVLESNHGHMTGNNFSGSEQKRANRSVSRIDTCQDLGNLTRGALHNFRLDIAIAENKKRVKEFMDMKL